MRPCAIIEQEIVSASLKRAREKYERFDAYWERGISWVLARQPTVGNLVPDIEPPRYAWGINQWRPGGVPRIVVVYRYPFDGGKILLERVAFHEPQK